MFDGISRDQATITVALGHIEVFDSSIRPVDSPELQFPAYHVKEILFEGYYSKDPAKQGFAAAVAALVIESCQGSKHGAGVDLVGAGPIVRPTRKRREKVSP